MIFGAPIQLGIHVTSVNRDVAVIAAGPPLERFDLAVDALVFHLHKVGAHFVFVPTQQ